MRNPRCEKNLMGQIAKFLLLLVVFIGLIAGMGTVWAASYPFSDDMENPDSGNWTRTGTWGYTESLAHSPTHSLTDSPTGSYGNNVNITATLSSGMDLSLAVMPVLTFWHRYAFENGADFGYVEVSRDLGNSWTALYYRCSGNVLDIRTASLLCASASLR